MRITLFVYNAFVNNELKNKNMIFFLTSRFSLLKNLQHLKLIMKIGLTLLFIVTLNAMAISVDGQSESFKIKMKNVIIRDVLKEVESKTVYRFFYSDNFADMYKTVSVDIESNDVTELLSDIFQKSTVTYKILENNIVVITPVKTVQQGITITGSIVDETNSPMPGVNVMIKGTTVGSVTDVNGRYSIAVPDNNAILIFSFVGYISQEIPVSGQTTVIDVTMNEDIKALGEVVVTALGIEREAKRVGYSISKLEGKDVNNIATVSPVDALAGKVSGVQIDNVAGGAFGAPRIQIRGVSTFSKNNQPIFVIDGVVIENNTANYGDWGNDLKNLNSMDFESISVLKGAAATALYGSRAINGLVLIQTKKGQYNKGLGINVTNNFAFRKVRGPEWQDVYGAGTTAWSSVTGKTDPFDTNEFVKNANGEPMIPTGINCFSWGPKMQGQQIRDYDGTWTTWTPQPKNYEQSFNTGIYNNTNVDLTGGTDRLSYYTSFTYTYEDGVYIRNKMNQLALNARVTYKLTDWLNTDLAVTYVNSDLYNPPTHNVVYGWGYDNWPRSFNTSKWRYNYKAPHGGLANTTLGDTPNAPGAGVWFDKYENTYKRNEQNLRGVYKINANITKDLVLTLEGNFYNRYYFEETKKLGTGYANSGDQGQYRLLDSRKLQNNYKAMLNYSTAWDNFDFNALVGVESFNTYGSSLRTQTEGGLVVPRNYSLSNSVKQLSSEGKIEGTKRINSVYAFVNVGYKNQLFLDLTLRNDWSSALTYTDGSGNNSYMYPSIGASWVFTETFQLPEFLTFGKLRASYANVGSDTDPYRITSNYKRSGTILGFSGDIPMYETPETITDPNLKPERKNSFEVGVDLRFFMNRLNLDVSYYNERTKNQIINFPVPSMSGAKSLLINGGELENQGFEIELGVTPISNGKVDWNINLMASHNLTTVKSLFPGLTRITLSGSPDYIYDLGLVAELNGSYGDIRTERCYQPFQALDGAGNEVIHANNGRKVLMWDEANRTAYYAQSPGKSRVIGNIQPKLLGNISTDVTLFNSIRISALLDYRIGGHVFHHGMMYMSRFGTLKSSLENRSAEYGGVTFEHNGKTYDDGIVLDGVFQNGVEVGGQDISGMTHQQAIDMGYVDPSHVSTYKRYLGAWGDGLGEPFTVELTYLQVREITLSYILPKRISQLIYAKNAVIGVFGRNLGYLYSPVPDGMNLDLNSNSSFEYMAPGITPKVRTFGVNLSLSF